MSTVAKPLFFSDILCSIIFFLAAVPLCKCSDSSFVCKSSAVEIQLVNLCWAVWSEQFLKPVTYEIQAGNRKWTYGRSCCHRSSLWLGELEHGLLDFHLWGRQDGLSQKLFKAEKNGKKNPGLLIIILKLKCSCLRGKSWIRYVITDCNTDSFLPIYTTPSALVTREAPMD